MRVVLEKDEQKKLILSAKAKLGSERKLARFLNTSKHSIYDYERGNRTLPYAIFERVVALTGFSPGYATLSDNWGQRKGGLARPVEELAKHLAKVRNKAFENSRKWHARMKRESPREYYATQHERFRKIGGYKFRTKRGHPVRNRLELELADCLFLNGIDYEYEPYMRFGKRTFFPDFKVGNIIIECTAWNGESKARELRGKIAVFKTGGYEATVLVPPNLQDVYKEVREYLVSSPQEVAELCLGSSAIPSK